jgi:hypothetical protein
VYIFTILRTKNRDAEFLKKARLANEVDWATVAFDWQFSVRMQIAECRPIQMKAYIACSLL